MPIKGASLPQGKGLDYPWDGSEIDWNGALAQLGERLHGMQEVSGSIPLGSTSHLICCSESCKPADEFSSAGCFCVLAVYWRQME